MYRAGNACLDWIANYSLELEPRMHKIHHPPIELRSLLLADVLRVSKTCLVTI